MVKGKNKGNSFEIKIYKELRNLGECKRTIGSGSSDESGDILFKGYCIECKHLKVVSWSMITKFWNKLKIQVEQYNKLSSGDENTISYDIKPVIIFRQNNSPIMVMTIGIMEGKDVRCITSYNIWKQLIR